MYFGTISFSGVSYISDYLAVFFSSLPVLTFMLLIIMLCFLFVFGKKPDDWLIDKHIPDSNSKFPRWLIRLRTTRHIPGEFIALYSQLLPLASFFVDCVHTERIVLVTQLRYADKWIVNITKYMPR